MKKFKKIGVLTSGGDAPGMNAAIRAVTRAALANGVEVMGIYKGYSGLINGEIHPLGLRDVSNIIKKGGTILYSDRCLEFQTEEGMAKAVKTCHDFGIDGIVAIGGDGTFRGATDLTKHGVPCVGLPATIDNDITSTDNTIGFYTAMNTVMDIVDKLRDTCESHGRCNVVEVMGRGAGDITMTTAIASGATGAAIPEIAFDEAKLIEKIKASRKLGKRNFIVIVSEAYGKDFGPALREKIETETGVESKFVRLAHIVRGGTPTVKDRVMASEMGIFAVKELLQGNSNLVVCERDGKIVSIDIDYALKIDKFYKGKLTEDEISASFDKATVEKMKKEIAEKKEFIKERYNVIDTINI